MQAMIYQFWPDRRRTGRLTTLALSIVLLCCGCSEKPAPRPAAANSRSLRTVALQLNWYPEAEHGGFYAALVERFYEAAGLDVEIRPGGRATPVAAELSLGRAEFAISNAADVLLFREQGADVVAIMAAMQDNPRCILVREDSGIENLHQLGGQTLQLGTGRPFVEYMKRRGVLEDVQVVPYFGTITQLVTTPNMAQQGYVFSEPLLAAAAGTPVRALMVSELGFNPYASVLITSGTMLRENRDVVEKMVQATIRGWTQYLAAPEKTNEHIVTQNQHGLTLASLNAGAKAMRGLVLPEGSSAESLGRMTQSRWQELLGQMNELELVGTDHVRAIDCYEVFPQQDRSLEGGAAR